MKRPSRRERENMSTEELEQLLEEYTAALRVSKARERELETGIGALRAIVQAQLKEIGSLFKLERSLAKKARQQMKR